MHIIFKLSAAELWNDLEMIYGQRDSRIRSEETPGTHKVDSQNHLLKLQITGY